MYKDSVNEEVRGYVERWAREGGANLDTEGPRKCKKVESVLHPLSAPGVWYQRVFILLCWP